MAKARKRPLDSTLSARLTFAEDIFADHLEIGEAFKEFIRGKRPVVAADKSEPREVDPETAHFGDHWRLTSYSAHGELRSLMLPSLVGEPGTLEQVDDPLPADADDQMRALSVLKRRRNRMWEQLARKSYQRFNCHKHKRMAIDDALQFGFGAFETIKDTSQRLCGFRYVSAKRVLFDCETENDPMGLGRQWDSITYTFPMSTAKMMARDLWGKPGYKFSTSPIKQVEADGIDLMNLQEPEETGQMVTVMYMFVRGPDPNLDNATEASEEAKRGKDPVYDGSDHIRVVEKIKNDSGMTEYKLIATIKPELPNHVDESPLTLVMLDPDNEDPLPSSVYQASHSMQMALNWALRYINTDAYLSVKRLVMFLSGMGMSEEQIQGVFNNPKNLQTLEVKDRSAFDAIKMFDFGQANQALGTVYTLNQQAYGQLSNRDVFTGLATTGRETATRAALSSERAQLVMRGMMQQVDDAIASATTKALMACMATMSAKDVANVIGDEYLYFDSMGNSEVWPWNGTGKGPSLGDIRREVRITLRPMSTRWVNPEQRLLDMDRISAKMLEFAKTVIEANQVNPRLAKDVARAGNAQLREYGQILGLPHADEITIDLDSAASMPMPQGAPAGPGGPGAPQAGGPPGAEVSPAAQQIANMSERMGLQTTPPGELGEMVAAARGNGQA